MSLLRRFMRAWEKVSEFVRDELFHRAMFMATTRPVALLRPPRQWRYEMPEPVIIGAERPFFRAEGGK